MVLLITIRGGQLLLRLKVRRLLFALDWRLALLLTTAQVLQFVKLLMAIGLTLSGVRTISFSLLFFFNHSSTFLLAINIVSISSIISHLGNEPFWRFIRHELVRQLLLVLIVISKALRRMALLLSLLILLIVRLLLSHLGWFS